MQKAYSLYVIQSNCVTNIVIVIKLSDYLIIDTLHNLVLTSVNNLLLKFSNIKKVDERATKHLITSASRSLMNVDTVKHKSWIRIQIVLKSNELAFAPDSSLFNESIEMVIAGFVDTVIAMPKLLSHVLLFIS